MRCAECGSPTVAIARRFCSRSCCGRWLAKQATPADRSRWGREGGVTRRISVRDKLLARLASLDRDEAIWRAWQCGRDAYKRARLMAEGSRWRAPKRLMAEELER